MVVILSNVDLRVCRKYCAPQTRTDNQRNGKYGLKVGGRYNGRSNIGRRPLKTVFSISLVIGAGLWSAILPTNAQVNVTQYHNHSSRDGLYIDSAFTQSAAANLTRDLNFNGTIVGNVYAQPLYIEGGPSGPMVIAVTESNNVYALNAVNGTIIWQQNVG